MAKQVPIMKLLLKQSRLIQMLRIEQINILRYLIDLSLVLFIPPKHYSMTSILLFEFYIRKVGALQHDIIFEGEGIFKIRFLVDNRMLILRIRQSQVSNIILVAFVCSGCEDTKIFATASQAQQIFFILLELKEDFYISGIIQHK